LVVYVMFGLIPLALSHIADYAKYSWRVGGTARMGLSKGLATAFLHVDDAFRVDVDEALLTEAMTHDTETLIKIGYGNFVKVFALMGQICLFVLFQVGAPLATGSSRAGTMFLQMLLFPLMVAAVLYQRMDFTRKTLKCRRDVDRALSRHVHDMVGNFRLLKDYNLRFAAMDKHEDLVKEVNVADKAVGEVLENNKYIMKWVTFIAVSLYVLNGGMAVINGDLRLGLYLTMTKVFVALGTKWTAVYGTILQTFNSAPALERIVHFMNVPTDAWSSMKITRAARRHTLDLAKVSGLQFNSVPIQLADLSVTLRTMAPGGEDIQVETPLFFDKLVIKQGSLVSLVGKRGHGKSTLLKLLGGAQLPDIENFEDGTGAMCFMPSHLRVLHVASEPMFLRGGLYRNLTFGTRPGNPDGRLERVKEVCTRVGLPSRLVDSIDPDAPDESSWSSALSSSEKHLLCIARALVANPEVLCIHKPTLHVNAASSESIIKLLREYVDNRGVVQEGRIEFRRPRTCILTSTRARSMSSADAVFKVDDRAIIPVDVSSVSLDDLC